MREEKKKPNKPYEQRPKVELAELLEFRSLPISGRKDVLIKRLRQSDRKYMKNAKNTKNAPRPPWPTTTQPDNVRVRIPDSLTGVGDPGPLLFKDEFHTHRMRMTNRRISTILKKRNVSHATFNINVDWAPNITSFWEKYSEGKQLPALFYTGCIIADLTDIRVWLESDDIREHVDSSIAYVKENYVNPDNILFQNIPDSF